MLVHSDPKVDSLDLILYIYILFEGCVTNVRVCILTLLFKVTLILDWLVMRRMGALMTSCSVFWIASASILIICQLTSLNVRI